MTRLRILADDLTGALDCAAAFGAGAPVHLGRPASPEAPGLDLVATATRDVPVADLPGLLAPCVPSCFTTAALGQSFVVLDDSGQEVREGEAGACFLVRKALPMCLVRLMARVRMNVPP